jgi:hypothetical protein
VVLGILIGFIFEAKASQTKGKKMGKKYRLTAQNEQGARTERFGNTIKECLDLFDSEYTRSGFKIWVTNLHKRIVTRQVKTTFK